MKYQGSDLVRVTSHDELRVGLLVVVALCRSCRGRHVGILVRRNSPPGCHGVSGSGLSEPCAAPWTWTIEPPTHGRDLCFCNAITTGRLYRLQEPPAEVNDYDVQAVPTKAKERAA